MGFDHQPNTIIYQNDLNLVQTQDPGNSVGYEKHSNGYI